MSLFSQYYCTCSVLVADAGVQQINGIPEINRNHAVSMLLMRKFHAKVYMEKNMVWGHKSHNFPYILACFLLPANWPAALAGKIPAELSAKIICLCLIYGWRPAYLHATLRAEFSAKFFLVVAFFWEFFTSPLPRFLFLLCHVAKFIYFSHSLLGHRGHQFWGKVMYNFDYTQINKPIWDTR